MYESETNSAFEPVESLPAEIVSAFAAISGSLITRTVLPWSEHCTECVWPTCYVSCDLYSPRQDGRCRRFVNGMVRVDCPAAVNGYLLKISFKQWGKLWTPGSLNLHSILEADRIERRDYRIGTTLYQLPLPKKIKSVIVKKRYSLKKRVALQNREQKCLPTSFLIECFNPATTSISLSLTIRPVQKKVKFAFQKLIQLNPGMTRAQISLEEISSFVDVKSPFSVELIPNSDEPETTLYFGLIEFVQTATIPSHKQTKVKCVVWDLDNTLWDGVLVESSSSEIMLKPEIAEIIKTLDQRGILQSVASKNNYDGAMEMLRRFGLDQFFLHPQISWNPKSEALRTISRKLSINLDSLLFVDDSKFELHEVSASYPSVRTLDAKEYQSILQMDECHVALTKEGADRRKMYQVEQQRQEVAEEFKENYSDFLKHCDIRLKVTTLSEENLERVHELTQRTNQMNFSGTRYDRSVLKEILRTSYLDTYVIACVDKFGSYGIVGFSIIDSRKPLMTDLTFSCRIQSKRIEHAFMRFLLSKYIGSTGKDFQVNYRRTARNAPYAQVFPDIGLVELDTKDGITSLVFSRDNQIADDGIVTLDLEELEETAVRNERR